MARTGRTRFLLSSSPRSVRGRWTDRPSYTVRVENYYKILHSHDKNVIGALMLMLLLPFSSSSELFTTEASHLRTLRVLDQVFFQKMRSVLNSDELACIFPNLPQVYELHGECVWVLICSLDIDRKCLAFI